MRGISPSSYGSHKTDPAHLQGRLWGRALGEPKQRAPQQLHVGHAVRARQPHHLPPAHPPRQGACELGRRFDMSQKLARDQRLPQFQRRKPSEASHLFVGLSKACGWQPHSFHHV